MKLRIARVHHTGRWPRRRFQFAVQISFFGILWDTMYFNQDKQELLEEFVLGQGKLVKALFNNFQEAMKYAKAFKNRPLSPVIKETWRV